jgi:phosphate starvation-inducible PhoH-like protein
MATKTLQYENPRFLQSLFANDITLLRRLQELIAVKVTTRDGWVRLEGDEEAVGRAERVFRNLENARRKGVEISAQTFHYVVESLAEEDGSPSVEELSEVRLGGGARRAVVPKTAGQLRYVEAMRRRDVVFGIGPAGTGKTYLAVASALEALKNKVVERIVLARPAVEAGEALGFLPGDFREKVFPYLRPLHDAITEMAGPAEVQRWMEREIIEIAPLAYMRGRTLSRAFIILDEAQNTTREQMFMFLTRIGEQSRCVVTGDPTQSDLGRGVPSGLAEAVRALEGVEGVEFCRLEGRDVVRHAVVRRIIAAYEAHRGQGAAGEAP